MKYLWVRGIVVLLLIVFVLVGPQNVFKTSKIYTEYSRQLNELEDGVTMLKKYKESIRYKQAQLVQERSNSNHLDGQYIYKQLSKISGAKLVSAHSVSFNGLDAVEVENIKQLSDVKKEQGYKFVYVVEDYGRFVKIIDGNNFILNQLSYDFGTKRMTVVVRAEEVK